EGMEYGLNGHVTRIRTLHLASLAERQLLLEGVEVAPQNYSGTVSVDTILSGNVRSESGASHWASFEGCGAGRGPSLVGRTHGGLTVALASYLELGPLGGEGTMRRDTGGTWASERVDLPVHLGEARQLFRT